MSQASVPNAAYIQASRVTGTRVFGRDGRKLGTIEDIVLTKAEGQAVYAVLSFGGLFGAGDRHYPIPWSLLRYDPELGGYSVELTKAQVSGAPSHAPGEDPGWDDPLLGVRVSDHYRPPVMDPVEGERSLR